MTNVYIIDHEGKSLSHETLEKKIAPAFAMGGIMDTHYTMGLINNDARILSAALIKDQATPNGPIVVVVRKDLTRIALGGACMPGLIERLQANPDVNAWETVLAYGEEEIRKGQLYSVRKKTIFGEKNVTVDLGVR